jgi:hypothetical protein
MIEGGDVAGECDAGSPGSGGASPYLRRACHEQASARRMAFPRQPATYFNAYLGFTLGNSPTRISPEGASRCGENRLRTFEPDSVRISSPFIRAKRFFRLTPGKPWAGLKLSCPFRANPSGRKHSLLCV